MKKALITLIIASFLGLGLSSCVVRTSPHHHHGHPPKARKHHRKHHKGCRPSHYWDGHRCRHKGKGHGARKHDY